MQYIYPEMDQILFLLTYPESINLTRLLSITCYIPILDEVEYYILQPYSEH